MCIRDRYVGAIWALAQGIAPVSYTHLDVYKRQFQSFSPKLAASQDVVYSQFVQDVENDRIKSVDISSNERSVDFVRADGSKGTTTAPVRDRDLINDLIQHKVEIKQAAPESGCLLYTSNARAAVVEGPGRRTKEISD